MVLLSRSLRLVVQVRSGSRLQRQAGLYSMRRFAQDSKNASAVTIPIPLVIFSKIFQEESFHTGEQRIISLVKESGEATPWAEVEGEMVDGRSKVA